MKTEAPENEASYFSHGLLGGLSKAVRDVRYAALDF